MEENEFAIKICIENIIKWIKYIVLNCNNCNNCIKINSI